jgi:hypothetical protein
VEAVFPLSYKSRNDGAPPALQGTHVVRPFSHLPHILPTIKESTRTLQCIFRPLWLIRLLARISPITTIPIPVPVPIPPHTRQRLPGHIDLGSPLYTTSSTPSLVIPCCIRRKQSRHSSSGDNESSSKGALNCSSPQTPANQEVRVEKQFWSRCNGFERMEV